jgi:GIY-YIG catalytic domain
MHAVLSSIPQDQCTIYALCEPETGEVRYIGKTRNLSKRSLQHLRPSSLAQHSRRSSWLKNLLARGLQPMVCVLQKVPIEREDELERWWIAVYRPNGRLTNETEGGEGVKDPPAEVRALIGWRKLTAAGAREIRERAAAGESTVTLAAEFGITRHSVGNVVRGKTWPQAGGPIMASLPRHWPVEAGEAARRATKGKPRSDEVRRKIGDANRGQKRPSMQGERHHQSRLDEKQVREIRVRAGHGESYRDLGAEYGVSRTAIRKLVTHVTWASVTEEAT